MKNILKIIMSTIIAIGMFSCDDPYADQPIAVPYVHEQGVQQDVNFVIAAASGVSPLVIQEADLNKVVSLLTATSLPEPVDTNAVASYILQISKVSDFSMYYKISTTFSGNAGSDMSVSYQNLNDTLLMFNNEVAEQTVYFRSIVTLTTEDGLNSTLASNIVSLKITPYKNPLLPYTAVTPKPYYIIGLANGAWNNSVGGLGVSIYPMGVVEGDKYNAEGAGEFVFTGYFQASRGFKLIRDLESWDEQWGYRDGSFIHNDGGSSDIRVPLDGYYTLTLNSIDNVLAMEAVAITPTPFTQISLIGGFNGWGADANLTACETTNNHIWYTTITFAEAGQLKFRANAEWSINWGHSGDNDGDPVYTFAGVGVNNGKNIGHEAGTYIVFLNDLTGCYYFMKQ